MVKSTAPFPITSVSLIELNSKQLKISWDDYKAKDINRYEIYIEEKFFYNIKNKNPKQIVFGDQKNIIYPYQKPELYIAVVPVIENKKILNVTPSIFRSTSKNGSTPVVLHSIKSRAVKISDDIKPLPHTLSYPIFVYNSIAGYLNLFVLVKQANFVHISDWVNSINRLHKICGGIENVVQTVINLTQKFEPAYIYTGINYENDFELTPGTLYEMEVKEPISKYCLLTGDVIFEYIRTEHNALVLVADETFYDAESWAEEINSQHEAMTGFSRVVTSITPLYPAPSESLIDTGTQYENNFNLVYGKGYIVEIKEVVENFSTNFKD